MAICPAGAKNFPWRSRLATELHISSAHPGEPDSLCGTSDLSKPNACSSAQGPRISSAWGQAEDGIHRTIAHAEGQVSCKGANTRARTTRTRPLAGSKLPGPAIENVLPHISTAGLGLDFPAANLKPKPTLERAAGIQDRPARQCAFGTQARSAAGHQTSGAAQGRRCPGGPDPQQGRPKT